MRRWLKLSAIVLTCTLACLFLTGCEDQKARIQQALIDMGYMPVPSKTPVPSETPDASETPLASETPDTGETPLPFQIPDTGETSFPSETSSTDGELNSK